MVDKYIVDSKCNVRETIEHMEEQVVKAVVILNDEKKVIGLFSNGDMRRFFLKGGKLLTNITCAMNPNPIIFHSDMEIQEFKKHNNLIIYPIVDNQMCLKKIITNDVVVTTNKSDLEKVPLVIMAGGKGTRLYPYTKILPKALIPIGDKTVSERIMDNFSQYGCNEVWFILNHKAEMIKAYYNEIAPELSINFLEEKRFLGTGGGLRLLKGRVNNTFFLSNCDIILNADLTCAYRTHKMKKNIITLICALKEIKIPYGVVETDETGAISVMKEKPELSFLTNTGVYIIEPEVIDSIQDEEFVHMPDVAQRCIDNGYNVGVFPISEKAWYDIGQMEEMDEVMKKFNC